MTAQFIMAIDTQDRIDAFVQMINDYHDEKRIAQIMDSRRRNVLNEAVDERVSMISDVIQEGRYVDTRDKNFYFHHYNLPREGINNLK